MKRLFSLLFSNSMILSWLLPQTMKGTGLHSDTWLTAALPALDSGDLILYLISLFFIEAGIFFLTKTIIRQFYIAAIRRLIRYGCGTTELMTKIDSFHIPQALKKRLIIEVIKLQGNV